MISQSRPDQPEGLTQGNSLVHHRRYRRNADHRASVDHRMTCSVAVIARRHSRRVQTRTSEGVGFLMQSLLGHIMIMLCSADVLWDET